ncbi:hypothetical protein TWF718_005108 [Orbilia javanica]|uniref:Uncharacterized protein n=1 Tax=Orbilia javanica TaxID=47235 RepID=A0AAN8ND81_9PEZI
MPRSPTFSPIFEFPTDIVTSLVIPPIKTNVQISIQSPLDKVNAKSPLTTRSKSRTGIPIAIEAGCNSGRPKPEASGTRRKPTSTDSSSRNPSLEKSESSYFEIGADLDDEDYLVDEYCHSGHKSALSFTESMVYSKAMSTPNHLGGSVTSQPSPAEQCLMNKGIRVEVQEYDSEKTEGSEQGDEEEVEQEYCGCFGWLKTFWGRGA